MKKTVNMKRLGAAEQNDLRVRWLFDPAVVTGGEFVEYPTYVQRPMTRGDCIDGERPCPFVSCLLHLALDVNEETGALKNNFPVRRKNEVTGEIEIDLDEVDFDAMKFTCALDVADQVEDTGKQLSLDEFKDALGLSYDRAFQVVSEALKRAHQEAVKMGSAEGIAARPSLRKQEPSFETDDTQDDTSDE